MRLDWYQNSLNDMFSVQTAPTLILLCSISCCWLPGVTTASQPRRTGAFTTLTLLNNVKRINPKLPQTPWRHSGDSDRHLDKCQGKPSSIPPPQTPPPPSPPPPTPRADFKTAEYGCVAACVYDIYYFILLIYDFAVGRPLWHMLPTQH